MQAYLGDITGLVLDHNKVKIAIEGVTLIFHPVNIKS